MQCKNLVYVLIVLVAWYLMTHYIYQICRKYSCTFVFQSDVFVHILFCILMHKTPVLIVIENYLLYSLFIFIFC